MNMYETKTISLKKYEGEVITRREYRTNEQGKRVAVWCDYKYVRREPDETYTYALIVIKESR